MTLSVLQHASTTAQFTSGTTGTASPAFGSNTTAGSCLVACVSTWTAGTPTISSVTTNGTAENWAQGGVDAASITFLWLDPNTGGGQKTIDVNVSFGTTSTTSDSSVILVDIFEVAGVVTASALDQSIFNVGAANGTSWDSTATGTTTVAGEAWFGFVATGVAAANTTATVSGPSSPWTNETTLTTSYQSGGTSTSDKYFVYQQSGYRIVSSTGTVDYSGTTSQTSAWVGVAFSLKGAAAPATALPATPVQPGLPWRRRYRPRALLRPSQQVIAPPAAPTSSTPTYYPAEASPGLTWRRRYRPKAQYAIWQETPVGQPVEPPAQIAPGRAWTLRFRPRAQTFPSQQVIAPPAQPVSSTPTYYATPVSPGLLWRRRFRPRALLQPSQQAIQPPSPSTSSTPTYFPTEASPGRTWRRRFRPHAQQTVWQVETPRGQPIEPPSQAAPGLTWRRRFRPHAQQGSASLLLHATGSGGVVLPKPALLGQGWATVTGTGSVALPKPSLAGHGWATVTGTGGVVLPKPSLAIKGGGPMHIVLWKAPDKLNKTGGVMA